MANGVKAASRSLKEARNAQQQQIATAAAQPVTGAPLGAPNTPITRHKFDLKGLLTGM